MRNSCKEFKKIAEIFSSHKYSIIKELGVGTLIRRACPAVFAYVQIITLIPSKNKKRITQTQKIRVSLETLKNSIPLTHNIR